MVATLWSVDDAKNAKLIRMFFENIRSGMPKDEALRQAKLRFLNELPHDEAHPVFWAATVANGGSFYGWQSAGGEAFYFLYGG
ncbi:MAG: CHAT domain-containing protein [Lewinellaceae bacterium]|nr:CHAT domain-containing protein [Lewinellaceae bacterium]